MKIGVIGLGNVGSAIAYSILQNMNVRFDELVLNDIAERVHGIRLDFCHAFPDRSHKIIVGGYEKLNECDIVIITASMSMLHGINDFNRMDLLNKNREIFHKIFNGFKPKKDAILIIVSNPSDIMAYIAMKLSGVDPKRVIGFGGQLDNARFRFVLSNELKVEPTDIESYVIGEHGNRMIPVFSQVRIKGQVLTTNVNKEKIQTGVRDAVKEIIKLTGATQYGPGQNVSELVQCVLNDEKKVLCVSALLNSEYGANGVYMSVPCVIGRNGVERIVELDLDEDERNQFSNVIGLMKEFQKL